MSAVSLVLRAGKKTVFAQLVELRRRPFEGPLAERLADDGVVSADDFLGGGIAEALRRGGGGGEVREHQSAK